MALYVAESVTGSDVRRVLARVIGQRGTPTRIRSANGSEFIGAAVRDWLPKAGAKPIPVAPARPWENGFSESFHSRLRDEFLDREEFASVADAGAKAAWWRREYNRIRPPSGIGYKTPQRFREECDRGLHGQRPKKEKIKVSAINDGTPISGGPRNG